jgi:hypothetical protein
MIEEKPFCPECGELDPFTIMTAAHVDATPREGEPFVCCSCTAIGTHTGNGLGVRRATPAEVASAIEDPAVVDTLELVRHLHEIGAL